MKLNRQKQNCVQWDYADCLGCFHVLITPNYTIKIYKKKNRKNKTNIDTFTTLHYVTHYDQTLVLKITLTFQVKNKMPHFVESKSICTTPLILS